MKKKRSERTISFECGNACHHVLDNLRSDQKGLSADEARRRLAQYGRNEIARGARFNLLIEFISNFKNPLIIILLIAAGVSALTSAILDAVIICVMVVLSVTLNFVLESGAERASQKLKDAVKTTSIVIRDGKISEIDYTLLVPGDIILLSAGSIVPADCRLLNTTNLFVNQSSLTGESFPAEKSPRAAKEGLSISDRTDMVFFGTSVVSGSGEAVVVQTGCRTEFGKIADTLAKAPPETEFEHGISKFGNLVAKSIIMLVLFIFLVNSFLKNNILESFMFALAVAVGLTPELLPMIMTLTMAKGSLQMGQKGVIVKRLNSIPNFGSMDVLCTDKTGTLTEDKIRLVKYTDTYGKNSEKVLRHTYYNSSMQMGMRNPLDEAVLNFKDIDMSRVTKLGEIPFDFSRKRMSVILREGSRRIMITKGAPEEILSISRYYDHLGRRRSLDKKANERITAIYHKISADGYRVLAVAYRDVALKKKYGSSDEEGLCLLGFVSFLDPPKPDAREAIRELESMGVEVKIITGDNEFVTQRICSELDINVKGVMLGSEMVSFDEAGLAIKAENSTIFARFSPDQKNRIIQALRSRGHVVGYMGDGINDAPSLTTADIGISVNSAADVAKEAAAIVLTKKSLKVLKEGILDGRKTFSSTMKYLMMNLSSNFGNMFSVAGAILFLPFLPMMAVQILLNNFLYDVSQVTIPSDNTDQDMVQKPKRWNMRFVRNFMLFFGPASSVFDFLTFYALYSIFKLPVALFQTGWFMESLATQTLVIHIIRTKKIPFLQSNASLPLYLSSFTLVAVGWIIPFTPVGIIFGFMPLPWPVVLSIAGIVILYLFLVQGIKSIFYMHNDF